MQKQEYTPEIELELFNIVIQTTKQHGNWSYKELILDKNEFIKEFKDYVKFKKIKPEYEIIFFLADDNFKPLKQIFILPHGKITDNLLKELPTFNF